MVALCRRRGRARGHMQPAPAAARAKQEVEKGSKRGGRAHGARGPGGPPEALPFAGQAWSLHPQPPTWLSQGSRRVQGAALGGVGLDPAVMGAFAG